MLIIFDLDGTLLNTMDDLASATNYALSMCGFPRRSIEECRQFVGNGVSKLLERALPEEARNPQNLAALRKPFFTYYDVHLTDQTYPYAGITHLLSQLQACGVKLAVCSNKYQRATEHLIHHFFAKNKFVTILGQRENIPLKPNPQVIEEILYLAKEIKENCLYVGDSEIDMQTAQNAGIKACGVTWGFRSQETLSAYNPTYLVDNPAEILRFPEIQSDNNRS